LDAERSRRAFEFDPGPRFRRIRCIDAHCAGEPLRIVVDGVPTPVGATLLEKRRWCQQHLEDVRRALIFEPRGHPDMYACLLTEPESSAADAGILFLHNEGYSTMCGHAILAVTRVGLELGWFPQRGDLEVRFDAPAGRVIARGHRRGDVIDTVAFQNVPAFVLALDAVADVDGLGAVSFDLAFGGAFYAYVDARTIGLSLEPAQYRMIIQRGMAIKDAVQRQHTIVHPHGAEDLNFLYGTILHEPLDLPRHSRHVCVFADGQVDRSPTGTGVSGRAAILHARRAWDGATPLWIASLVDGEMSVRITDTATVGGVPAVVPEVAGTAYLTGRHEFWIDPGDPLREGFCLR
jgi:trans-L-3-hydroxyproline dehydratase